jgi:hypothetical protein
LASSCTAIRWCNFLCHGIGVLGPKLWVGYLLWAQSVQPATQTRLNITSKLRYKPQFVMLVCLVNQEFVVKTVSLHRPDGGCQFGRDRKRGVGSFWRLPPCSERVDSWKGATHDHRG